MDLQALLRDDAADALSGATPRDARACRWARC
jgi:hypothetical protein